MSEPCSPKTATAPFNAPNGDVILRSCDNVDFYVFKTILSLSSQFFSDLFSIPQPPKAEQDDESKPIIQVEESTLHLDYMLRFLYPCQDPDITQLEDVERMLNIARKYDLLVITQRLEIVYMRVGEIDTKPVKAYLTACRYEWWTVAQSAARAALKYSNDELLAHDVEEDGRTADQYLQCVQLLKYHTRVRTACRDICVGERKMAHTRLSTSHSCPRDSSALYARIPVWFAKYIDRVAINFMLSGPLTALDQMLNADETIREIQKGPSPRCKGCTASSTIPDLMEFIRALRDRLASAIDEIPVEVPSEPAT